MCSQMSRQPLPIEEINQIHEDCKNLGLLVGRGGLFSQVRNHLSSLTLTPAGTLGDPAAPPKAQASSKERAVMYSGHKAAL